MAVNLGAAYVDIVPSTSNLAKELKSQADPIFSDVGRRAGVSMSSGLGSTMISSLAGLGESITETVSKWFKRGATVGLAAVTGVAAVGLTRGLGRVLDTEDARVQLGRMGLTIGEIDTLLKDVDNTFQGTPFANPDGFNISSQLFASGRSLAEIPGILGTIADLAAHGNVPIDQMAALFVRAASEGRVMGDGLNRLTDANIPLATLADALGLTTTELRELASEGGLTADMFFEGLGAIEMFEGAAKAAGDTTRGAWSNVWTALATGFDKFLTPLFGENGTMVTMLKGVREGIRDLFPVFQQWGEAFAAWVVPAAQSAIAWFQGPFLDAIRDVRDAIESGIEWYKANREEIDKIVAAVAPAAAGIAALAVSIHLVRSAFVLLMRATPIGVLFLLATALVYAWQNSEKFREVVTDAFEKIRDVIGPIISTVRGWIDGLFSGASDGGGFVDGLRGVWDAAVRIFTDIGLFLSAELGKWVDWFRENWDSIKHAFENVVGVIRVLWERFGDNIIAVAVSAWNTVKEYITAAMEVIRGVIEVVLGILTLDWDKAWNGIKTIFSGVWRAMWASLQHWWTLISEGLKAFWSAVSDAGNALADWFRALPGRVLSWLGDLLSTLPQKGRDLLNGFLTGMTLFLPIVSAWLGNLPVRVVNFVGDVLRTLWQKGRDVMDGMLRGMVEFLAILRAWLSGVPARIVSAIPNPLGILYQVGRSIIDGLTNGMRDGFPSAQSFLSSSLNRLYSVTPGGMARGAVNVVMGGSHDGSIVGGRSFRGLRDDEIPLVLQKGQAVLTEGQQRAMLAASPVAPAQQSSNVVINNNGRDLTALDVSRAIMAAELGR
jgi:tape measure domain-containing protein